MKANMHPPYHMINVQMTDGTTYQTRTTWGGAGEKLQLVIDPLNHPAYTGERRMLDSMGRMEKFMKKYGTAGATVAAPAAAPAAPAAAPKA